MAYMNEWMNKWYGRTDRNNPAAETSWLPLGDEWDSESVAKVADDMPAHAKSTLSGVSITIPITNGRLNLGTWQGIYFCEYRNYGGPRELVVTIIGA